MAMNVQAWATARCDTEAKRDKDGDAGARPVNPSINAAHFSSFMKQADASTSSLVHGGG
jgi:hypothetical protein